MIQPFVPPCLIKDCCEMVEPRLDLSQGVGASVTGNPDAGTRHTANYISTDNAASEQTGT